MKATSLLTGWTCRHLGDTAPGKTVTLPHDAMLAEPRTALSAGGTNTGWYEGYDYEYRRTLTVFCPYICRQKMAFAACKIQQDVLSL